IPFTRSLLTRLFGPQGIYEWVIARTKYIDDVFERALADGITQVLVVGAGFDSRAVRFKTEDRGVRVFELDAAPTQEAKLHQYTARGITVPPNVVFVAINFDKETIDESLLKNGFCSGAKTLVVAEGVFQYLKPESARATFGAIKDLVGPGSWLVFDYAHASVLRGEGEAYGETRMTRGVNKYGESWQFGLDERDVEPLLREYAFHVKDLKSPQALEQQYFEGKDGNPLARINGTQSIVLAQKT
ncbi:MAG TPA: SAM-dependent methyltransferase, partial [Spirochaetia bacterium]|nr:SAM-dependent methyltransferase [Spirochaetia bacterium]